MNVITLVCVCSALGLFALLGFEVRAAPSVDVGSGGYSEVMRGLPWEFKATANSMSAAEREGGYETRYDFVSVEPVGRDASGALYLRADLSVSEFGAAGIAESGWRALRQKAHPDMGLSYAWDYLIFRGQTIYHLHAACTFSDRSFDTMVGNLSAMLPQQENEAAPTIRCRCGGGCRGGDAIQAKDGAGVAR